jgi:hypothetical protein
MFLKNQISPFAGLLPGLLCWSALALPYGTLLADDTSAAASSAAPRFISIPSPASQLRPLPAADGSDAPTPPAPPATETAPPLSFASDDTPAPMLPVGSGHGGEAPPSPPQTDSTAGPSVAADTTPAPSLPPGPGQDPALAKSPLVTGAADPAASNPPNPSPASPPATPPSPQDNAWKNSYVNLINLLVNRGILTKKDSHDLVAQAEHDAAAENSAKAQAAAVLASPAAPPNPDDDTMRVGYVPESVKEQMRDEIKQDVMQQARDEHWAAPYSTPDWVKRYHVAADIRLRYEGQSFPDGNDNSGVFVNFNAINTGAPFDITKGVKPPLLDVDQNRNRFRLRARLGADIDVGQGFTAGLRLATGSDNSPVTENQTFGSSNNGQGGDFSKYSIWLDRAFLRYELGGAPEKDFSVTIGRFDNPFFGTSMIWADDLGFDGLVAKGKYQVTNGVTPFVTGGAFPVYNTDFNFATDNGAKFQSEDKWLYAVQGGTDWKITDDFVFKGAVAYYDYENIQGKVSAPFDSATDTAGNTDDSRPSFAQNGNTYVALRNIVTTNGVAPPTSLPQYFGLATPFHELAVTSQLDYSGFDPYHVILIGEFVKNMAFDRNAINNNGAFYLGGVGPQNNLSSSGTFAGGDIGYNLRLTVGHPTLTKLWDWNLNLTYRYVETDAVVDGFTDADFGGNLTGTNLQGYIIGGNLALTSRVWTSLKWMSSESIAGPPYSNDLIQVDINAKF